MSLAVGTPVDPGEVLGRAIEALNGSLPLPLQDVDRALKAAPTDYRLWHIKGLIHREQEARELALPALRRAVELAPEEPLVAHGYARTLLEAGQPSVDPFVRAMRLKPGDPEVVSGMVASLVAAGRTGEAIAGLERSLSRSPLWVEGHVLLASIRWSDGERSGFTRSFDAALAAHPDSIDLRREQLIALLEAEQFDEVLSRIQDGRQRYGEQPLFIIHEAATRSEMRDDEAADSLFDQIAPLTNANFDVRRVRHWLRTGRLKQASKLLDHWLETSDQEMFWPYAATTWRLTGDPRSDWLEADERLVGVYDIADRLPQLESLAATLRKLHTSRSQPFSQSVRGGTQTDGHLFQRVEPDLVAMREAIRATVLEHVAQLPPTDARHPLLRYRADKVRFTGAWSVRLKAGGQHANHVHPLGWLSSALYIVLPPDLGQGQAGWLTLGEPQAQLQLDVAPRQLVEPKPGRLALFPSWMWHGTRTFGEGERMTVAFDVARPS